MNMVRGKTTADLRDCMHCVKALFYTHLKRSMLSNDPEGRPTASGSRGPIVVQLSACLWIIAKTPQVKDGPCSHIRMPTVELGSLNDKQRSASSLTSITRRIRSTGISLEATAKTPSN